MQNELNTSLIEAVKEKLPLKENLANLLIDTLYIGKEAIYRRLRGEVPFTLEEAALISRKLGVSLDNVIGVCFSSNAVEGLTASEDGCIKTSIFSASILTRWKFLKKYMIFKMILYLLPDIYILWIISGIA